MINMRIGPEVHQKLRISLMCWLTRSKDQIDEDEKQMPRTDDGITAVQGDI